MRRPRVMGLLWCVMILGLGWNSRLAVAFEPSEEIASRLPSDCAIYARFDRPGDALDLCLQHLALSESDLQRIYELAVFTDPLDGSDRSGLLQSDSTNFNPETISLLSAVLSARSVHVVWLKSREELGGWVVLFEQEARSICVSRDECRRLLRLLIRGWRAQEKSFSLPRDFEDRLSEWEMTVATEGRGQWIGMGSSETVLQTVLGAISAREPKDDSLAGQRGYQSFSRHEMSRGQGWAFVSTRNAKHLMAALGWVDEQQWLAESWDEVPWMGCWWGIETSARGLQFDRQWIRAVTMPLIGKHELWKHYRPFGDFVPPLPSETVLLKGRSVDLAGWQATARRIYPELYGPGVYEQYAEDAVTAFKTGISRPGLGDLQVEYWFQEDRTGQGQEPAILYQRDPELSPMTLMQYLEAFYAGIQSAAERNGKTLRYQQREVEETTAWWSDEGEDGGSGSVMLADWVVQGKRAAIDRLIIWGMPASLTGEGVIDCEALIRTCASRFGLESFHAFELERGGAVQERIAACRDWIAWVLPTGWQARGEIFEIAREKPELLERMSRAQQLRYHWEAIIDRIESSQPVRARVETFQGEVVTGESWWLQR